MASSGNPWSPYGCRSRLLPPHLKGSISREEFDALMDEKDGDGSPKIQFTVEDDRATIKGLYAKTYGSIIGCATEFDWKGLGWECEFSELLPVLITAARTLQRLDLSSNKLRGGLFRLQTIYKEANSEANRRTFLTRSLEQVSCQRRSASSRT